MNGLRGATALAAALTLAALVAGCASGRAPGTPGPPAVARGVAAREPAADPRPFGAADTAFGLELLGAWCRADPRANLVLSPSSLASALGMAYLGARGDTARAMARVLHLPAAGGQGLEAGLQARSAALRGIDGPGVTVAASDQVWADPALKTLPGYLNAVATGYDAGVAQVPLLSSPDRAAGEINQAIASQTRGQIPRLLSPDSLRGLGWILTDALYLRAAWAAPFQAGQTAQGSFTTAEGRQVTARFMNGGQYPAASVAGWTAVRLPYRGGRLQMIAMLPAPGILGCAVPAAGVVHTITARLAAAGPSRGVALPRVSLGVHASLKDLLGRLGMGIAFTQAADFAGLSPRACCIGLVEHAATLRVAEQGTVASAASAVGITPTAGEVPRPRVVFDHPYLMLVTDSATGEPLFIARVADASARLPAASGSGHQARVDRQYVRTNAKRGRRRGYIAAAASVLTLQWLQCPNKIPSLVAGSTMMPERVVSTSGPITIDRTSPVPLYFQLAQHFESAIRSGTLKVGARLENEVKLAETLGLSRPTVRAAFLYLANKGLVVRKRGAGTVVANERIDRKVELTSLYDDLAASGRTPATRVLGAEVTHASDQVAEALQLPERSLVMSLERIRLADGEPMALMHNYLPAGLIQLSIEMLEEHGLYELLRAAGIGLYSATQRMCAKNASAAEARTLNETRGAALLTMERIAYDQAGRPVEFARHLYRASRYAFTTSLPRVEPVMS